jgi:hypothetical protein
MKFCKDCKWFSPITNRCAHPNVIDPITGEVSHRIEGYCDFQRSFDYLTALLCGCCGRFARWFKKAI